MSADQMAKYLGAKVKASINWTWATDFPSPEKAQKFIDWLDANGYEHRGYCPAQPNSVNSLLHVDGVRYRKDS